MIVNKNFKHCSHCCRNDSSERIIFSIRKKKRERYIVCGIYFIDICHHNSLFCTLSTYTAQNSVIHSGNEKDGVIFIGCGRSVMTNFSVFYLNVAVVLSDTLFFIVFHFEMAFQINFSGPQTFLFRCLYFLLTPIALVMKIPIRTFHQHIEKFDSHAN